MPTKKKKEKIISYWSQLKSEFWILRAHMFFVFIFNRISWHMQINTKAFIQTITPVQAWILKFWKKKWKLNYFEREECVFDAKKKIVRGGGTGTVFSVYVVCIRKYHLKRQKSKRCKRFFLFGEFWIVDRQWCQNIERPN